MSPLFRVSGSHVSHALADQWPSYVAYLVSFLTIGVIWINHHAMLRRLVAVDHSVLVYNLVLLMFVGILPWTTAVLAEYLREHEGEHLAAGIYSASFLAMSIAFYAMHRHLLLGKPHLVDASLDERTRQRIMHVNRLGLLPYAIAVAVAFVSAYASVAICGALAVYYALPATTADG